MRNDVDFPSPIVSVDVVLFTLRGDDLMVLLPKRPKVPFKHAPALPGGYVHVQEDGDLGATARRVLAEKTGLVGGYFLEQLGTFSGPARDPRGWSLSVVYYAVVPVGVVPLESLASFVSVKTLPSLPFDHEHILAAALERLRGKSSYSSLPAFLLPEEFTLPELQHVYEQVMGVELEPKSFRRKIEDKGMIVEVPGLTRQTPGRGRSPQVYRLSEGTLSQYQRTI